MLPSQSGIVVGSQTSSAELVADHVCQNGILRRELNMARTGSLGRGFLGSLQLFVGATAIISEIGLLTHRCFIAVSEPSVQHLARYCRAVAVIT